jgi:hypothetical protein
MMQNSRDIYAASRVKNEHLNTSRGMIQASNKNTSEAIKQHFDVTRLRLNLFYGLNENLSE